MVGLLPLPRWTLAIHAVQILFAIVVLGLDAYGIHYIPYNALIFSLVTALLTMGICIYIIGTTLFLDNLYNAYLVLGLHVLMIIFWVTDLGLVANLAHLWSDRGYGRSWRYRGYYDKRGKRDTTLDSYRGALIAGSLFGAVEFVLWILSAAFLGMYLNKSRTRGPSTAPSNSNPHAPAYGPVENNYPDQSHLQPQYQQQPYPPQNTYPPGHKLDPYAQQPGYVQQQQQPYA